MPTLILSSAAPGRSDNFNRADTTNAIGTPSDGGSDWQQLLGAWGISSNQGYNSDAATQATCVLEASTPNATLQCTLAVASAESGFVMRAADSNNYLIWNAGGQACYRRVAGTFTSLGAVSAAAVNGDVCTMTCDAANLIVCKINGSTVISVTESAGASNTLHGLRCNNGVTPRFEDFSITPL